MQAHEETDFTGHSSHSVVARRDASAGNLRKIRADISRVLEPAV
jgi:hypothetical protein